MVATQRVNVKPEPLAACQRCKLVGTFKHQPEPCSCFDCVMVQVAGLKTDQRGDPAISVYQPPAFKELELLCRACAVGGSCHPAWESGGGALLRQAMLWRPTPEILGRFKSHEEAWKKDNYGVQVSRAAIMRVLLFLREAQQPSQEVLARQQVEQQLLARQSADIEKVQSW
jgi:hypothetical protein